MRRRRLGNGLRRGFSSASRDVLQVRAIVLPQDEELAGVPENR